MFCFTKSLKKIPLRNLKINKVINFSFSRIGIGSRNFKKEILKYNTINDINNISDNYMDYDKNKIIDLVSDKKSNKSNLFINTPHTEFSERLNSKINEIEIANEITQRFYFEQFNSVDKKSFWVTHDAPSAATGKPHLGGLNNKVIKDAINRLKILQGHRVHYQIGFDCFGVNIEDHVLNLEKQKPIKDLDDLFEAKIKGDQDFLNIDHKKLNLSSENILEIRKKCKIFVIDSIIEHIKYFLRIGIMFDIKSIYSTLSRNYQQLELECFKQLYEKGLIYRDYRVIFWSAEENRIVDYEDLEEKSELADCMVVKFPIKSFSGDSKFLEQEYANKGKQIYLLGFLQEPWKYIGVRSLSINPNTVYCLAKIKDDYCVCAYKRLPELAKRSGEKSPEILLSAKGSSFSDLLVTDPVFKRDLPIILDKDISEFFGTCINVISPAHDFNSERISRGFNLSLEGFLDEDNYIKPGLGMYFHNTHYLEASHKLMSKLKSSRSLLANWKFENMYYSNKNTDERIILRSISSWFLSINKNLKNECIKELALTHYYPQLNFDQTIDEKLKYQPGKLRKRKKKIEKVNKGYKNIVEEIDEFDEWCISEMNSWGVPIPYFNYKNEYLNKDNKIQSEVLVNSEIIEHTKNLFAQHGSDIWWTWTVEDLLPEKYKHEASKLKKGRENFDSMFDSSISWFTVLYNKLQNLNDNCDDNSTCLTNEEILSGLKKDLDFQNYKINVNTVKNIPDGSELNSVVNNFELNSARTKEHLKDYNHQLKEFIIDEKNIYTHKIKEENSNISNEDKSEKDAENSEGENKSDEEDSSTNNAIDSKIENKKIKSLIPKNILFNHINFKCLNYSTSRLFPADIIVETNYQHANWFLQSLMTSVSLLDQSCFRSIKTHGYIEDSSGNKLSQSAKSYIDPLDIIDGTVKLDFERKYGYGADTVRLYLLKNDSDTNFGLSEELLEKGKTELKQIRKIAKHTLGLLNDFHEENIPINFYFNNANILDQIMINDFIKFYSKITESMQQLNFKEYIKELISFTNNSFFDYYLTAVKNRIILKQTDSEERRSGQFVLKEIFFTLVKLLSPIIPFTTEDIYKNMKFHETSKKNFLGLEDLPKLEEIFEKFNFRYNEDFIFNAEWLLMMRKEVSYEVSKLSKSKKLPEIKRNQVNLIFKIENHDSYEYKLLKSLKENIHDFFGVNMVSIADNNEDDENNVFISSKGFTVRSHLSNMNSKENSRTELNFKYTIHKSGLKSCVRCYNHKCNEENKICTSCQDDIKANYKAANAKSITAQMI